MSTPIDYRELLIRYIQRVASEEGTDFIPSNDFAPFGSDPEDGCSVHWEDEIISHDDIVELNILEIEADEQLKARKKAWLKQERQCKPH